MKPKILCRQKNFLKKLPEIEKVTGNTTPENGDEMKWGIIANYTYLKMH